MAKVLQVTACAAAVGLALYGAAGYWGVPWAVRTAVEKVVSAKLNRTASLQEVHFNPLTWTLELKGLSVPEPNSDPLLSLERFVVDLSGKTLLKLAPIVEEVTIEGLHVNALLNDANRKLINDLMGGGTSSSSDEKSNTKSSSSESSGLPQFAVYNISVSDSSLRYRDAANNIDQAITDLSIKLPFLSTMESSAESLVTPALAFKLNGAAIEATGSTKPFGSTLEAKLGLRVRGLDVAGLARIVPKLNSDALRVNSANLSTNLTFTFRNATGGKPAKMLLSGETTLANLSVTRQDRSMVTLPKAVVDLGELDLVERNVAVKSVALSGLKVQAERNAAGINLLRAFEEETATAQSAEKDTSAKTAKTASTSTKASSQASDTWKWSLGSASLTNASIAWSDSTVKPAAKITLSALTASAKDFSSEKGRKGSFSLSTDTLGGRLEASGTAEITPLALDARVKGSRLTLNALAPYITQVLGADLRSGVGFDVKAKVSGSDVTASGSATVTDLRLRQGKTNLVTLKSGTVQLGSLNTAKRSADVTLVSLNAPMVNAVLTKKGMNLANLGSSTPSKSTQTTQKTEATKVEKSTASTDPSWSWRLGEAKIEEGTVHFTDESVRPTAKADLTKIGVSVKNLSSQANTQGTAALSCALGGGTVSANGKLGLSPLSADFKITGNQVGLKPFSSVLAAYAGLGAKAGTFDTSGQLKLSTKSDKQIIGWKGNMALTDLNLTNASGRALMSWKKASLTDMDVETSQPIRLVIGEVTVDQPAQQQAQTLKGLASLVGALSGNSKTSSKIDKVAGKLDKELTLKNVRYENGHFSAAGVSAASIEGVILQKFSDAMSSKLGTGTSTPSK